MSHCNITILGLGMGPWPKHLVAVGEAQTCLSPVMRVPRYAGSRMAPRAAGTSFRVTARARDSGTTSTIAV